MIPARTSRLPMIAIISISKSDCKLFSTSIVFVITRNVNVKTTNPMSDTKPPRAILKRCLRVKYGIAFFSHHNSYKGKITLSLVKTSFQTGLQSLSEIKRCVAVLFSGKWRPGRDLNPGRAGDSRLY
jgi:hypothetical protein